MINKNKKILKLGNFFYNNKLQIVLIDSDKLLFLKKYKNLKNLVKIGLNDKRIFTLIGELLQYKIECLITMRYDKDMFIGNTFVYEDSVVLDNFYIPNDWDVNIILNNLKWDKDIIWVYDEGFDIVENVCLIDNMNFINSDELVWNDHGILSKSDILCEENINGFIDENFRRYTDFKNIFYF